ncbi:MAG: Gfo/Idh/MocA family oxidoreductase [Elusimicrobia bacterium]|nr:Gfo/Idh/MocA family oxidoreductase [Elusimicrobiota bacterium]MBU2615210.1 Gfo/Idh/MocA family oxidoreductase [Elusimicrobiota bacterium]
MRRAGPNRKIKELIKKGVIGKIISVEANFSHEAGLRLKASQWRSKNSLCPALPLTQLGVHIIDTLRYFFGPVKKVYSIMKRMYIPVDNKDVTKTLVEFKSGLTGYIGSDYVVPYTSYINVYGTKGVLSSEKSGEKLYLQKTGSVEKKEIPIIKVDTLLKELEEFADCIRRKKKPEVDGNEGLANLMVVRAAIESNKTNKPVFI